MYSKTAHIPIIEEIAKGLKAAGMNQLYIELGISRAACFNVIAQHFQKNMAVDIKPENELNIMRKNYAFFGCSTDKFFEFVSGKKEKANLIFIDANHDFENVKRDFENSWQCLCNNGLIILHDTYPPSEEYKEHCKDAYRIIEFVKSKYPNAEIITLPFYFGLTIVRKI